MGGDHFPPVAKRAAKKEKEAKPEEIGSVPVTKIAKLKKEDSGGSGSGSGGGGPGSPVTSSSSPKRGGVFSFFKRRASKPEIVKPDAFGVPTNASLPEVLDHLRSVLEELNCVFETNGDSFFVTEKGFSFGFSFELISTGTTVAIEIVPGEKAKKLPKYVPSRYFIHFSMPSGDARVFNSVASKIEGLL